MSLTMLVDTECSICGKKLGGKNMRQETRVGIFEPLMDSNGHVSHFAMGDNRLALCKSCTQSLYSWIKNRRKKKLYSSLEYPVTVGPHDCDCTDECLAKESREEKEFLSMAEKRRYDAVTDSFMDNIEFTKS